MTVKDQKRGRPKGSGNKLNETMILDRAKSLMQEDKKIPSIRKLANNLAVDPMAIYHYFNNKNDLLEAITTSLIEGIYQPVSDIDWKQQLNYLCTSYLALLDNYPGLLSTLLSMTSHSPALVFNERFNIVISTLNLDEKSKQYALNLLVDYLHGYALALNCQGSDKALEVDMVVGQLHLYCIGLENI